MAITIGSNIAALKAERQLNQTNESLSGEYNRLSSGQRITKASDDAASLAIALDLNATSRVYSTGIRNINDGISALTVVDGALGALSGILIRISELSEQSANGTYSHKQRSAMNTEANALADEYNRIVASTSFNGVKLLDGGGQEMTIQYGYGDEQSTSVSVGQSLSRTVGTGTFQGVVSVVDVHGIRQVEAVDLNNDGNLDLVGVDGYSQTFAVHLGNGNGTFGAIINSPPAGNPQITYVAFADINGDGKQDAVALGSNQVYTLFGNGNGTFRSSISSNINGVSPIKLGDVNGDNILDVLVTQSTSEWNVALGRGDGTFSAAVSYNLPAGTATFAQFIDFNNDDALDVIVTAHNNRTLLSYVNNGSGSFSPVASISPRAGAWTGRTAVADFNLDGYQDFVEIDNGAAGWQLFLGNGDGTFRSSATGQTDLTAVDLTTNDLNGDGRPDLVIGAGNDATFVYLGNGDGTFSRQSTFTLGTQSFLLWVRTADLNNDGAPDAISADREDSKIFFRIADTQNTTTLPKLNLNSRQSALSTMSVVSDAFDRVTFERANIGASLSRLQTQLGVLGSTAIAYRAAESRISSADIASEAASATRLQILQQITSSVLAQANQQPQLVLRLLE